MKKESHTSGQAILIAVVYLAVLLVLISSGLISPLLRTFGGGRDIFKASRSYYAAESGSEDAAYRISRNLNYSPVYNLALDDVGTLVTVTDDGNDKVVEARGDDDERIRTLSTTLNLTTTEAKFFYGIQVGEGGLAMSTNSRVNGNVYTNGNITGTGGSIITGTAIAAGGISSEPSVEWVEWNSNYYFARESSYVAQEGAPTNNLIGWIIADLAAAEPLNNADVAQSFTASATAELNRVSVYLGKAGNPTDNIIVRITADNGNKPANSSLATAVITPSQVGVTPSWINVAFATPPTLTSGSKYWILLDNSSLSDINYWMWRLDSTDGYPNNTGKFTTSCCSGSPIWTNVGGDLTFRVWLGGVNSRIEGLIIGDAQQGLGKANLFVNSTIHGSACPNPYCQIDNQPREELPISAGVIQDWRDAAALGGVCEPPICDDSGNFFLSGSQAAASLGPIQIPGQLNLSNGARLTVTGTIWVQGNINFSNNSIIKLDPSYGAKSGMIVSDGQVAVSNGCVFQGSGTLGSYILLLSAKDAPAEAVMSIGNNSEGVIYYAPTGRISLFNNATAKEASAYGISMSNNSVVSYESGLQSVFFSSGPGASFQIKEWKEI